MLFPVALVISLVGLISSFIAYFPGGMSWDSFVMWGMGWQWPWHDWHSPYIALLMTVSRIFRDDPAVYLFFLFFLHWGGLYLFAAALRKAVGNWALIVPLLGFTPMFLGLSGSFQKTILQTAIFLFVFGVIYLHSAWNKRLSYFWMVTLLIFLITGIPVRVFGYLCAIPLTAYLLYARIRRRTPGLLVFYLAGAIVLSGTSLFVKNFVVYDVLQAQKLYKVQTLYRYDLAAMYALTGVDYAPKMIRKEFSNPKAMRKIYTAYNGLWRIMNVYQGGVAPGLMAHHIDTWQKALNSEEVDYYRNAWAGSIRDQPSIWIEHKIHAFFTSLGYKNSMKPFAASSNYKSDQNIFGLYKSKNILSDMLELYIINMQDCVCQKPWFWFLVTFVMLFVGAIFWLRVHVLREVLLPQILLLSSASLFYPQYFLLSLSNHSRFTYWATTATILGSIGILLILLKHWNIEYRKKSYY